MAYIDRGGVRIWYEAAGSGPTLLLTHGFSATSYAWQPQLKALSDAYQVVVWDIRGHGRSDSPEDPAMYSEALTVADMAAVLDAVDAERAVIGGLSLGGYLSLAFNISHPERVAGLVLCDTGPGYRSPNAGSGRRARRALPRTNRLHGRSDSGSQQGDSGGSWPQRQRRPA